MNLEAQRSRYRQVRLTVTEEEGWVSIRVMVKPLAASWRVQDTVYHHRIRRRKHSQHWTNLLAGALQIILGERLPPSE